SFASGPIPDTGGFAMSGQPEIVAPFPTGNPANSGFYNFAEFLYYKQTFALGNQVIAQRGLVDTTGLLTGAPGTFIGSGEPALQTSNFGRSSASPGWKIGLGYKFDSGVSVYASFTQTIDQT